MKKVLLSILSSLLFLNIIYAEEIITNNDENIKSEEIHEVDIEEKEVIKENNIKEETNITEEKGRWDVEQPEEKETTKEIILEDVKVEKDIDSDLGKYIYNITICFIIPEDYDKETIEFSPKVYETIKEQLNYNGIQPGDSFNINFEITNNSKYDYKYDEKSFVVFPDDDNDQKALDDTTKKFNDTLVTERNHIQRRYNTALKVLGINEKNYLNGKIKLTDEIIDEALKATKKYSGIEEYTKYLLDFYNTKYHTSHTKLEDFSYGIIKEIFGSYDPYYTYNEAYYEFTHKENGKTNSLYFDMTRDSYSAREEVRSEINKLVKEKGFVDSNGNADINAYLLDYYNKKYNLNAKTLDELPDKQAYLLFAQTDKSYIRDNIEENNTELLKLYFDYFYNKGISWTFEDDNLTEEN